MKPADITIDKVRDVMRRSAEWFNPDEKAYGFWTSAEEVVWFVHGLDGGLRYRAGFAQYNEHKDAVRATLTWPGNGVVHEPTAGQIQTVRKLLNALVDEGCIEVHDQGAKSFAWLTPAMREAKNVESRQRFRIERLRQQVFDAFSTDGRRPKALDVSTKMQPRFKERGVYDAYLTLTLDEELIEKLLHALSK